MKNEIDAEITSHLRKIGPDKPSPTFSSQIMKEIEGEPERDLRLQTVLLRHTIEPPSVNFTDHVLDRMKNGEFKSSFKPVIGRKAWGGVIVTFIVLIAAILLSDQTTGASNWPDYFIALGTRINTVVSGVPLVYLITFSTMSVLVIGDYVIRTLGAENKPYSHEGGLQAKK